jgi:hypothetical protein
MKTATAFARYLARITRMQPGARSTLQGVRIIRKGYDVFEMCATGRSITARDLAAIIANRSLDNGRQ